MQKLSVTMCAGVAVLAHAGMTTASHLDGEEDRNVFEKPVRLMADGEYVKTEAPGYAAPCWTDVNGDTYDSH